MIFALMQKKLYLCLKILYDESIGDINRRNYINGS